MSEDQVRLCVLGPVIVDPPSESGIGGSRQRRLLAALVGSAGLVVSSDRLVEVVFEGEPTNAASVTLRSYVARLRRALDGSGATVTRRPPGYVLELGPVEVDAVLFEQALTNARSLLADGSPGAALDHVVRSLELWRGPAYAEFADEEWIQPEALRLDELRTQAEELRLKCLVDLGRHAVAIPELTALADRFPLRESVRTLLLVALYRSGRQADAVRAATAYRDDLGEVGLEPTGVFTDIEDRIVVQDPDLRLPPPTGRALRGYRLGERLGGADDTEVHAALQPGVERLVVVTSFGPSVADEPLFIREFEPTVQRVARIEHAGLVEILDVWREPGSAHVVTRLLRDGSLTTLLDKGPLSAIRVGEIVSAAASALAAAHAAGLCHGQLSADDVLFEADTVRIAGVGTADLVARCRGASAMEPGPARDQSAVAALAFEALTGFHPGDDRIVRVSQFRPELLALDAVFARAGAAAPLDRYSDIITFARSFTDAIGTPQVHPRASIANPYKGLRAFSEADSADFFGREDVVSDLVEHLANHRVVSVIGASGSGKSSVVRAGVVARLRSTGGHQPLVVTMVPGTAPFDELTDGLRRVAPLDRSARLDAADHGIAETVRAVAGSQRVLLVIDQLEELFTLCDDPTERARFVDGLMDAVEDANLDVRVMTTLRADFLDRPLQYHRFGAAVSSGAVAIPAMSPADIERCVVEPAKAVGVTIDGPVVAELIADVVDQPAALPLLQFSLTELFADRRGDRITLEDHHRLGGVTGAIARRADRLYSDATSSERTLIRLLFLRLVSVESGSSDIRRRTDRSELISASPDGRAMQRIIDRFGAARLLSFDRNPATREPTVEVAHEALLRHWPRLRRWIEDAGTELVLRAHLTAAAAEWAGTGRDDGALYRGSRLAAVEEWGERIDLTEIERRFLDVSLDLREAAFAAERRQLEEQVRANRRLRRALSAVAVVLVVALAAGFTAVGQRNRAQAETARAEQARGRALAVSARSAILQDRSLALLLAVEGASLDTSYQTRLALLDALGGDDEPFTRTIIPTPASDYTALAISTDGSVAAAKRSDGDVDMVDLVARTVLVAGLPGPAIPSGGLDISADGQYVVTSGTSPDGTAAIVYSTGDGTEMLRVPERLPGKLHESAFVPETSDVVIADADGVLTVHDIHTGNVVKEIDTGTGRQVLDIQVVDTTAYIVDVTGFGPDDDSLVSAWNLETGSLESGPAVFENELVERALAVGDRLILAGTRLRALDLETLAPTDEIAEDMIDFEFGFTDLAVSPDGLIALGANVDLQVWAGLRSDGVPQQLPITGQSPGVAFTPDGRTLVTADSDGSISTWRLGWVEDLGAAVTPEGPGLVTVASGSDVVLVWARQRGVQVFDAATIAHKGELPGFGPEDSFLGLDVGPDGTWVGTLTCPFDEEPICDATATIFDLTTMEPVAGPAPVGQVWSLGSSGVEFTGDGRWLAVASADGTVKLLDTDTLEVAASLAIDDVTGAPAGRAVVVTAGSREGRSLVAGLGDFGEGAIWDVTEEPAVIGPMTVPSNTLWFGPRGDLYVGSLAGPVQVWDPLALEPIGPPFASDEPAMRFSASGEGTLVLNSGFGGTSLYDIETRRPLSGDLPGFVSDISADGAFLFLGGIGFDQGGTRVAALPLDVESLTEEACLAAGRNLTESEWGLYMPAEVPHRATCPEWPLPK